MNVNCNNNVDNGGEEFNILDVVRERASASSSSGGTQPRSTDRMMMNSTVDDENDIEKQHDGGLGSGFGTNCNASRRHQTTLAYSTTTSPPTDNKSKYNMMREQQQKQNLELYSKLHVSPVAAASSSSLTENKEGFSINLSEEFDILDVVRERQSNPITTGIMSGKDVEKQRKGMEIVATQQSPCKNKKTANEDKPEEFNILDVVRQRAALTGVTETEIESQKATGANRIAGQQSNTMAIGTAGAHRTIREAAFSNDPISPELSTGAPEIEAPEPLSLSRHQPVNLRATQPGAFSGAPGEDLQRRSKVRLVGVTAAENSRNDGRVVLEGTLEENHPKRPVWWKGKPVILSILLVVVVAIIVPAVFFLQSNSSSDSETTEQEQQEEKDIEATIKETWEPLVPDMTNATITALEDPFSQQSQAYAWISEDQDWDTYEDWRKQQRFAMMCFYYAFRGKDLLYRFNPTHYSHECDWLLLFGSCRGNDRGEINRIGLRPTTYIDFHGTMPPEIAFLSNLETIDFSGEVTMRPLEDMFPLATINSLPPIKSLLFDQCEVGGSMPSTLGLVTSLGKLELSNSSLVSTIPSQLGLLPHLSTLTLSSNGLTGSIPEEIGELPFLINLDVSNNPDLEFSIPSGFCSDDRIPLGSLVLLTDWCSNSAECCGS